MNPLDIKNILKKLVEFKSISPVDAGCQDYMMDLLTTLGFSCQRMNQAPVSNFFACYGKTGPLLVFAGHTDVVPPGNESAWHSDPFSLQEQDGVLYGRGVADMKGSLACFLVMAQRFLQTYPDFQGRLGFLITSGEEGNDFDFGTPYVMEELKKQGVSIDYCVVGEPSSLHTTGDVIKIGRRGSLSARITLFGKQGHVAYPHLADNPIHKILPALLQLSTTTWDMGNDFFPPTSLQITHLHSGGHASNIIPGELVLDLNFRYSTEQSDETLQKAVCEVFTQHALIPEIEWRLNGKPFLTKQGHLLEACQQAITQRTQLKPELSTSGGTSDGRFIAPYDVQVLELGPPNATIHQANECVRLHDLEQLEAIYFSLCEYLLLSKSTGSG